MREILFRGKDVCGRWFEGGYYENNTGKYIISPAFVAHLVDPETVCQYTGLTDKNGRKIFEGDIMRNAGNVVEFYGGDFCINGDSPLSYWTGTEVIGNIYDNPELLEVKQNEM